MRCLECGHDVFVEFNDGLGQCYFECGKCCMGYGLLGFKELERLQAFVDEAPTTLDAIKVDIKFIRQQYNLVVAENKRLKAIVDKLQTTAKAASASLKEKE